MTSHVTMTKEERNMIAKIKRHEIAREEGLVNPRTGLLYKTSSSFREHVKAKGKKQRAANGAKERGEDEMCHIPFISHIPLPIISRTLYDEVVELVNKMKNDRSSAIENMETMKIKIDDLMRDIQEEENYTTKIASLLTNLRVVDKKLLSVSLEAISKKMMELVEDQKGERVSMMKMIEKSEMEIYDMTRIIHIQEAFLETVCEREE